MVLKSNGTVVVWGDTGFGLQDGAVGLTNILAIAAGSQHCLALKSDNTVIAWGINNCGQSVVPSGLTDVVAIAAGACHSLAVKRDGTVVTWGWNNLPGSLSNVVAVGGGYAHSLALKSDGQVVAWGQNESQQSSVPPGLSNVVAIAAGGFHGLALVSGSRSPAHCTPHKAKATVQWVNGFVVGAIITDSGCGYTNVPLVLIQDGGGSGAAATAVLTDGRVTAIIITSAGIGYETPPRIVIASPPFVPTVSISVSKVKVVQKVVLGRHYVLEASHDAVAWSQALPPFSATSESVTNELDVDLIGRFFRVREVP